MEQMRLAIIRGEFPEDPPIPTVRELALNANVNPNTMQKALSELEKEGLIYSRRTVGRYITKDKDIIKETKMKILQENLKEFLSAMYEFGYENEDIIKLLKEYMEVK